jgi:hypothetical protein
MMKDGFYEFEHECDAMPEHVRFCKINGDTRSQFTYEACSRGIGLHLTTLYGVRFCPYCGDDMEGEADEA